MNDKDVLNLVGCVLVIAAFLLMPVGYIINGFVLVKLWDWFIVPTFDAPTLSVPIAIGVSIVVGFLTHQYRRYKEKDKATQWEDLVYGLINMLVSPFFTLLIAYIVYQFV